ncbi:MAG TPA: TolC family protein [Deltaproteobacteria bacterium]|nr:TolC family protein [Deltaproteobacteria bacterium]HPJ94252.1 TolC family protein [Deltaproteobacteria bacterium]HPR51489.1 TolC family protein [Deltaproteobacteria bacterium]
MSKRNEPGTYLLLTFFIILSGCVGPSAVQKEISTARDQAYIVWQAEKNRQGEGETVIDNPLSLDQAVVTALSNNRELQVVLEQHNIAKGRIIEAYEGVLPNVAINGSYTRQDRDSETYEGTTYPLGQENNYAGTLSVTQPLYSGAAAAALRASRYYDALANEQVKLAVQSTIFKTIQAYYQVLLAGKQLGVTKVYADLAESHLKDVQTKRKYGTASDFNVLRSQVELSNARAEMIRYSNELHTAQTNLLKIIGVSQESRIELTDKLTYEPLSANEEEAIKEAFSNRPDLAAAVLGQKLQEEALKASQSEYWPKLDAFYNHTLGNPDPYLATRDEWDDAWTAGIKLSVPIFKGFGRKGRVIQNKAELKKRQIEVLDTREKTLFEVRNAILSLQDAKELVETQELSLVQAEEGLRIAEVGYREGSLDQVSVLDARAALTQAQLLYYQSLYAHCLARVNLELVKGTLEQSDMEEKAQ